MIGSSAIAAYIAHLAFWVLIVWGRAFDELQVRGVVVFVVLWLAGYYGLPYVPYGVGLFTSWVAVLDIVLVFMIFKADVDLT